MPSVEIKENESFDYALRRFKRSCIRAGVIAEARRREYYEKPTWVRKRKKLAAKQAAKRHNWYNSPRRLAKHSSFSLPFQTVK